MLASWARCHTEWSNLIHLSQNWFKVGEWVQYIKNFLWSIFGPLPLHSSGQKAIWGQNFKMWNLPIWLQIQNPCKKLSKETVFLFLIFHLEHGLIGCHIQVKFALLFKILFISIFDDNFDYVPDGISKKERHFLLAVFCKDSDSAIRLANFPIWNFDLIWPFDLRHAAVAAHILTRENFWRAKLI